MARTRRFNKPLTLAFTAFAILGLAGMAQASPQSGSVAGTRLIAMSGGSMGHDSGMGHETGVGMSGGSMHKKTSEGDTPAQSGQQGMGHGSAMSDHSGMSHDSNMNGKDSMGYMGKSEGSMNSEGSMKKSGKW